jgi:uncharacterized membrane protein YhaH (DUF805 family)
MATTLAGVLIWIVAGFFPWRGGLIFMFAAQLVFSVPLFAMFARRLHDQGLSAWGVAILPPVFAISIYEHLRFILLDARTGIPGLPELPGWVSILWVLLALPGTKGANSYGADPRAEQAELTRSGPGSNN